MTYNKDDLIKQALAVIEDKKIMFISHLPAYLPSSRSTDYNYELHKLDSIKDAIAKNRIRRFVNCLNKCTMSDNPTLLIALMKIIGTVEDCARLNGSKQEVDHTSLGKSIAPTIIFTKPDIKKDEV